MGTAFRVPDTEVSLEFERDATGRLTRISCGDRIYLDAPTPELTSYDGGFVTTTTISLPNALLRAVRANGEHWTETYRWDADKLLREVDGVTIDYDAARRVTSCRGPAGDWFYGYSGPDLTVVDSPRGTRQIVRDATGRPVAVRENPARKRPSQTSISYDVQGRRTPAGPRPRSWHCDAAGRLWTVTAPDGRVLRTYLWNDFHCVGRVDGPPGESLAAVFSLDLTGTPVRVIERGRARRLPRDAFGESLLDEGCVPGLFGGAVDGAFVRLAFRCIDPRTGAFDAPDPFTGGVDDPRRATGYQGPLAAEFAEAGPYAVARNCPLSLADPTGAISDLWWFIPSALTWSYQNTLASIFGFWLTLDFTPAMILWFLPNLLTLFLIEDLRDHNDFAGFFDVEFLGAKNYDGFALRSGGLLDMVQSATWTYQFIVNEKGSEFEKLEDARLFAPNTAFTPSLYGTLLRCAPSSGDAFLLRGQRTPPNGATLTSWARSGGKAQPAIPGSLEPVFPEGALHFSAVMEKRRCPQDARVTELRPEAPLVGSMSNRAQGTWAGDARGLARDAMVALFGTTTEVLRILSITSSTGPAASTVAGFDAATPALAGQSVRLRGLTNPAGPENLTAAAARRLGLAGTTLDYAPDDLLRLGRAGAAAVTARIDRLEASVAIDVPLPASFTGEIRAFRASTTGEFNATILTANQIRIRNGPTPGRNQGLVVGTIPTVVQEVSGTTLTLDRDVSALGGPNTPVKWRALTRGAEIGRRTDPVEPEARLTYAPSVIRSAPASGFLWCEAGSAFAARSIASLEFDGIVVSADLPDPAATYAVESFKVQAPDIASVAISTGLVLGLDAGVAGNARAFHLLEFSGAGITALAPPLIGGATLVDANLTATVAANNLPAIVPSDVLVLGSGGTLEAAVVREVRTTVKFMSDVPGRDNDLEAVLLGPGFPYPGDRLGDRQFRVRPELNGDRVDMPRFRIGELVRVSWGAAGIDPARERLYRVDGVDGCTLTGADDAAIDPAAGALTVERLTIRDPKTGGSRLARAGRRVSAKEIDFAVWSADDVTHEQLVAVLGDSPVARRVDFPRTAPAATRQLTLVLVSPTRLSAPIDVSAPDLGGTQPSGFSTRFRIEGDAVTFTDAPTVSPGTGRFLAVPYVETPSGTDGKLKAGTVRVPDDHENAAIENDRRQALTDHELTHTQQSARLGPWLFTWFPNWLTEVFGDLPGSIGAPEYSRTVNAQYGDEEANIEIPDFGGVSFEDGSVVQVSQDGRTATLTLRARSGQRFRLNREDLGTLSSKGIRAGAIGVRKEESGFWTEFYEVAQNVLQFLTIGGLMNLFSTVSYGGLLWLILRLVQAIRGCRETRYRAAVTGSTTITLANGVSPAGLVVQTRIAIQKGSDTYIRTIAQIAGQVITLGQDMPLTGDVELTVYTSSAPLFGDLHDYFPATASDRNRPAVIRTEGLTLAVDDRVVIRSPSTKTMNTVVTAVNPDGTVEVEEPVLVGDHPTELLVAKIGRDDPVGWADQQVLNQLHLGFLQYLHDPYGQIHFGTRPSGAGAQLLTRSARYLFGTESWGLPALTGYFWWDNAYRRGEAELSAMEQEASFRSGDTYCPVASLHGDVQFVGDVARYWLTGTGYLRDEAADMIETTRQDAPGANWRQYHALTVTAPHSGYAVPDVFATKDNGGRDVRDVSSQGWIPTGPDLERSSGRYVAFTGGGAHTIDARRIEALASARNAQQKGPSGVISSFVVPVPPSKRRVRIAFPVTVQDVSVSVAGQAVAEGDVVKVIPFQTARVDLAQNGARRYRVTVAQPGRAATVPDGTAALRAAKVAAGSDDYVEISRFYEALGDAVAGIGPMHLATDVDIAIRRLMVEVTDRLDLRGAVDPSGPALAEARPGDAVFLLVPAPRVATPSPTNTGALPVNPTIQPEVAVPASAQAFLGDSGVAYRIAFDAQEPPEEDVTVSFDWTVGTSAADSAPVKASLTLKPHFQLTRVGGAGFDLARGASLTLQSSDGVPIALEGDVAGVTSAPGASPSQLTLTSDAGAAPGPRTILVRDTAAATPRFARRRMTVT